MGTRNRLTGSAPAGVGAQSDTAAGSLMSRAQKPKSDGALLFESAHIKTNAAQSITWKGVIDSEQHSASQWDNNYRTYINQRPAEATGPARATYPAKPCGSVSMLLAHQVQIPPEPVYRRPDTSQWKVRPRGEPYMLPPRKFVKQWNHNQGPYSQYQQLPCADLPARHVMHSSDLGLHQIRGQKPLAPTRYLKRAGVKSWVSYLSASQKNNTFHHSTDHSMAYGPRTTKPIVDPLRDPSLDISGGAGARSLGLGTLPPGINPVRLTDGTLDLRQLNSVLRQDRHHGHQQAPPPKVGSNPGPRPSRSHSQMTLGSLVPSDMCGRRSLGCSQMSGMSEQSHKVDNRTWPMPQIPFSGLAHTPFPIPEPNDVPKSLAATGQFSMHSPPVARMHYDQDGLMASRIRSSHLRPRHV